MTRNRAVSLFSNCGAGDFGYRQAGFSFDVMAELDSRRLEVCLLNHPEAVGVSGDIRKTWPKVIAEYRRLAGAQPPALLCACPPCQGMSSARSGKGRHDDAVAGSKDDRNLLVTVVAKVAKRLMPSMVVVENVPAFFSRKVFHPKDGKPVSAANFLIAQLAKDYNVFPLLGDLCEFGVPQSRSRAFLTFIRKDIKGLEAMISGRKAPFPETTHADHPITLATALRDFDLPSLDAGSAERALSEGYGGLHSVPVWNRRIYDMVAAIPPGSGRSAWDNDICISCGETALSRKQVRCLHCQSLLPRPTIKSRNGRHRLIKGFGSSYRRMHLDRPAATVTTASGHVGSDYTIHPIENRLLSLFECALLQTFPKDFLWGSSITEVGTTHVREMIGEAVPPAFTALHGRVLLDLLLQREGAQFLKLDDVRVLQGWKKLSSAARIDGRKDPRRYERYLENDAS